MTKPKVEPRALVHALGDWVTNDAPLFRMLAVGLAGAIEAGDLETGQYLPSERTLAPLLSVSRGTVVAAYAELVARGLVERRQGSGTWITGAALPPVVDLRDYAAGVRSRRLTVRTTSPMEPVGGGGLIDLGVSILVDSSGVPDHALRISRAELEHVSTGYGYQALGIPQLRQRLADLHRAAGLPTSADQVAITAGGQHAIALVAQLLLRPGQQVVVESPTYPGAIDAFTRAGAALVPVATDGAGARVDAVAQAAPTARLAYVMPSCHNPTGAVMPEGRRRALAAVVDDSDMWLLEDNTLGHLVFADRAPLPIAAFSIGEQVVSVGSLDKLLWGGLRVGWVRAHPSTIERLGRVRAASDFGNPAPTQLMALHALDDIEQLTERRRRTFAARADLLGSLLRRLLPSWTFVPPDGGLSIWARIPTGTAEGLAPVAARHGVAFLPGGAASADDAHPDWLRLSFASPPEQLHEAVLRLARAWADYTVRRRPASQGTRGGQVEPQHPLSPGDPSGAAGRL